MKRQLPDIPLIHAPHGPLQLAQMQTKELKKILAITRELLPSPLLRWGDRHSEAWLQKSSNPYQKEIAGIANLLEAPGGYALNLCFEWGCTTGYRATNSDKPMDMFRTLDWPFRLGADVVVARHETAAGHYFNITWPGYVGVLTALAPKRFAAAINQAPLSYGLSHFSLTLPIDWIINRFRVRKQTAIPPAHLLRQVFDTCRTYEEAKAMLTNTPVCIPVIFTLTGAEPGQGCIIERRENDAYVIEGVVEGQDGVANHWINPHFKGRARPFRSKKRRAKLLELLPSAEGGFDWLIAPVLNMHTRLSVEMNAGTGHLRVQGWHGDQPQTTVFSLGA